METYNDCSFTFRWCVVSSPELQKCQDLRAALASKRVTKNLACVLGSDHMDCMEKVNGREADLFTGDGGDIYTGGRFVTMVACAWVGIAYC